MPLHLACRFARSPDVVHVLLDAGADMHARDSEGRTPLHWAAEAGRSSEVVQMLLDHAVDPYAADKDGKTPLQLAEERETKRDGATRPGSAVAEVMKMLAAAEASASPSGSRAGASVLPEKPLSWARTTENGRS